MGPAQFCKPITRREWIEGVGAFALAAALQHLTPAYAWADAATAAARPVRSTADESVVDLAVASFRLPINSRFGGAVAINGSVPGPLLRLREGDTAVLRVANHLNEVTSIHWHGVLVPAGMDGVPGVSFAGIRPGETFTYRFPVRQSGTYWYHSHAGGQELLGMYAPLIIDPIEPEPFSYERDFVVMLSDWSFESPLRIISKLKKQAGYYNFQRRTLDDFLRDVRHNGLGATMRERLRWSKMRMDPTDFADVTGYTYTYLLNGLTPEANWTGVFRPGERVRLRFVAAGAMTYFDIRIPGLKMTVVQADGQNIQPVGVDEFRIAPGETYDVIVQPENRAYTVFAEAMDRSGYTRGTLAPRAGMTALIPERRRRPLRTMADMGMDTAGMDMKSMGMPGMDMAGHQMRGMEGADRVRHENAKRDATVAAGVTMGGLQGPALPGRPAIMHGPDHHGPGNSSIAMFSRSRLDEPGDGFEHAEGRVLVYTDLKSTAPQPDWRPPTREIELHLTGNMDRYMWSFNGKKYSEAPAPIPFHYGERLRIILVNDTMMEHPIHLHGMWMELENGADAHQPRKHTISIKPAERVSLAVSADAPGQWAMHCHLLLHMEMGMFRVVGVSSPAKETA
jgi:CopA family copper-resistance protein